MANINQILTAPQLVSLWDDFNDASIAPVWTTTAPFNHNASVTVLEQNNRVEVTPLPSTVGLNVNGFQTTDNWDFSNRRVHVEIAQAQTGTGGRAIELYAMVDTSNFMSLILDGTTLRFRRCLGGTINDTNVAFNSATHRWWRLRNDIGGGNMFWDTSTDGLTWTQRRQSTGFALDMSVTKFGFLAGTFASNGAPGVTHFDNFKFY